MNIILFSKNRAAQLELLIRSMKKYFKEFFDHDIKILYKSTSPEFTKGYELVQNIHNEQNIKWTSEFNFQDNLIGLFDKSQKHTVFFVDDNIFKEPFSITDDKFKYFDSHGDVLCLSLRLHPRLTYCYSARIPQVTPQMNENNVFLWKGQTGDYGYPMSLDGHVFRTKEIYFYILNQRYNGPNPLESQMAMMPLFHPKMICYNKSIILNNPVNKVQDWNNNVHGDVTAEFINEQFLLGKIIDLTPFEGFENISCHQEMPIIFI